MTVQQLGLYLHICDAVQLSADRSLGADADNQLDLCALDILCLIDGAIKNRRRDNVNVL